MIVLPPIAFWFKTTSTLVPSGKINLLEPNLIKPASVP
jgi:hypothetical protein